MITWANLRASAAPWLLLPAWLYIGMYMGDVAHPVPSGYGVESGELAAYGLATIAPAVAGAAAWEAGRHRLLGGVRATSARSIPQQLLRAATPVLTLHLALIVGALVLARRAVGVWPDSFGWLAVAHLFVLPLGWLLIGWCLGGILPRSIAAPIAGIGCWAWLSIPHTLSSPWVRHLGGFVDGTSTVTDVRDTAVYTVPWLVAAGLALASCLLVRVRRRVWGVGVSILVAAATLVGGRVLVIDWGYHHPTSPRSVAMACTGEVPRVCAPPEYQPYVEQLRRDALAPIERLKIAGIPAPRELSVRSQKLPLKPGTWPLHWSLPPDRADNDRQQYAANLAESAVAGTAAFGGVTDCGQPGSPAAAWAALVMGVNEQAVRNGLPRGDWAALQEIRRLPAEEQTAWFNKAATSQKHCRQVAP
ncbi:hypothetical protein QFZ82_003953 [Streptomyces sp. V4I23]|uniref:DUF7224 domain-containing protein n=1 Tax=Streptomyces sp. V4I23 TaxID=3042282 RepID=UPI002784A5BB|nr:hypothetical protein [Streptomyces sp. V4I23]MDQ1009468.1 hypothetical protein [Streptomyces sp. V4I23]